MRRTVTPVDNISTEWEEKLKPRILACRRVPLELAAEILDCTVPTVQEMLCSGQYAFGKARPGKYSNSYEIFPLRFIAWYEGKLT